MQQILMELEGAEQHEATTSWLQEILGVSKWKENIKKEEGEVLKPPKIEGTSRQKKNFGDRCNQTKV